MDEASGLPQDSSPYGFCHMTAGTGSAYGVAGPFPGAEAITVNTTFTSPVYTPLPAPDVNYGSPLTMEAWLYLHNAPSAMGVVLGAGNIGLQLRTDRKLAIHRAGDAVALTKISDDVIPLDTWTFIELTMSAGLLITCYIGAVHQPGMDYGPVGWPVPNGNMLYCAQAPPADTHTMSNLALIKGGPLEPDLTGGAQEPQVYRSGLVF
jgi:hypothetical protein